jgi:hypothetical protein
MGPQTDKTPNAKSSFQVNFFARRHFSLFSMYFMVNVMTVCRLFHLGWRLHMGYLPGVHDVDS